MEDCDWIALGIDLAKCFSMINNVERLISHFHTKSHKYSRDWRRIYKKFHNLYLKLRFDLFENGYPIHTDSEFLNNTIVKTGELDEIPITSRNLLIYPNQVFYKLHTFLAFLHTNNKLTNNQNAWYSDQPRGKYIKQLDRIIIDLLNIWDSIYTGRPEVDYESD